MRGECCKGARAQRGGSAAWGPRRRAQLRRPRRRAGRRRPRRGSRHSGAQRRAHPYGRVVGDNGAQRRRGSRERRQGRAAAAAASRAPSEAALNRMCTVRGQARKARGTHDATRRQRVPQLGLLEAERAGADGSKRSKCSAHGLAKGCARRGNALLCGCSASEGRRAQLGKEGVAGGEEGVEAGSGCYGNGHRGSKETAPSNRL